MTRLLTWAAVLVALLGEARAQSVLVEGARAEGKRIRLPIGWLQEEPAVGNALPMRPTSAEERWLPDNGGPHCFFLIYDAADGRAAAAVLKSLGAVKDGNSVVLARDRGLVQVPLLYELMEETYLSACFWRGDAPARLQRFVQSLPLLRPVMGLNKLLGEPEGAAFRMVGDGGSSDARIWIPYDDAKLRAAAPWLQKQGFKRDGASWILKSPPRPLISIDRDERDGTPYVLVYAVP